MKKILSGIFLLSAGIIFNPLQAQTAYAAPGLWQNRIVFATNNAQPIPDNVASRFNVTFDKKGIRIRVEMKDPNAADLKTLPKGTDGEWPHCESIEMFFDPGRTCGKYFQIAVGANGVRWDSRWLKKEKTGWTAKVEITSDGWNVTFFLPYTDPGMQTVKEGDVWGFNFCRNVKNPKTGNYFSTWAHVGSAFKRPERFGSLIFGTPDGAKRARSIKIRKSLDALAADLKRRGLEKDFTEQLKKMEQNCTELDIRDIREEAEMVEKLKGL